MIGQGNKNVLFLFADQLNARCLSIAGHPNVQTPNLDRIAAEGVRFENAFAQSPVCTPSRMCFLSGLYPSTHGYYALYGREPDQRITSMFTYFGENRYRTGALGKLHTPRYWIERDCQFLYDEFIEYPKYLEGCGLYDSNDNRSFTGWRDGERSAIPFEHSCEAALAKQVIRFVQNQGEPNDRGDSTAPWFAWASFSRPHSPLTPSEPFASMYPPDECVLPPSASVEAIASQPERIRRVPHLGAAPDERIVRKMVSAYLGLVSQVDHAIGMILDFLESEDLLRNTIIVFSSDHGDYAGEHGLWSKLGGISSRAITRIPLLIRDPDGRIAPHVEHRVVESIDLFPTLADMCNLPVPDHCQGHSLFRCLDDPSTLWPRTDALTENAYRKALATSQWRYVANIWPQHDELYHVADDPWEMNNRLQDPDCRDVVLEMQRKLLDRVVRARRPITHFTGPKWRHDYDRDGRASDPVSASTPNIHL